MKMGEFRNLRIGDIVHIRGKDVHKEGEVIFIKYDEVVVECLDPDGWYIGDKCGAKLFATNYKQLNLHMK